MGNSFFEDLHLIRENSGLSLDDIKGKTMIPTEILSSFETSGLVGHPNFNSVYLHSLAKAYADVLGISRSEVKLAVDETLASSYSGRLAAEYLAWESPERKETAAPTEDELDRNTETSENTESKTNESEVVVAGEKGKGESAPAKNLVDELQSVGPDIVVPPKKLVSSSSKSTYKSNKRSYSSSRKSRKGIFLGAGILSVVAVLASILWFTMSGEGDANEEAELDSQVVSSDDLLAASIADSLAEIELEKAKERARWVVPDTMSLQVVAASDIIQAMEITRDQVEDHPRWVELGDTVSVTAVEKFSLYKGIDGIELYLDGRPVPKELGQVTRYRIDIERNFVQAYFDSLDAVTQ